MRIPTADEAQALAREVMQKQLQDKEQLQKDAACWNRLKAMKLDEVFKDHTALEKALYTQIISQAIKLAESQGSEGGIDA